MKKIISRADAGDHRQHGGWFAGAGLQRGRARYGVCGAVGHLRLCGGSRLAQHLRFAFVFRRRHLQQGKSLADLAYRAPLYPLTPVLGFLLCLLACVGLAFDPTQRIALWCGIPFVLFCYAAYHLTHKSSPKPEEANDVV